MFQFGERVGHGGCLIVFFGLKLIRHAHLLSFASLFVLESSFLGETRIFLSSTGVEIGKRIFLKCIEIGKVPNVINDHQPAPKEAIKHKLHS